MAKKTYARGHRSPLASFGIHATLVVASFIAVFPIVWIILTSFKPKASIRNLKLIDNPTLENYTALLNNTDFLRWFSNSVIVAIFTMIVGIAMAATAGFAISRYNFPGKRPLMWTFLITQMFPVAILIVPIYSIMSAFNLSLIHI